MHVNIHICMMYIVVYTNIFCTRTSHCGCIKWLVLDIIFLGYIGCIVEGPYSQVSQVVSIVI